MAEKRTIDLEIKDNTRSLKAQYKEAVIELQKVSQAYGETSAEAVKAAKAASLLKDQIADTNNLVDAFNPDAKFNAVTKSVGGVLDGFQAVQGGLGLVGVEGEAVQATLLKVQSAMALSQGLQGLMEAKDSFKQLYTVIKDVVSGLFKKNAVTMAGAAIDKANVVTTGLQATASGGLAAAQTGVSVSTGVASNAMKVFRTALISTGIGAIVVAIGLLIANMDKVAQLFKYAGEKVLWAYHQFEKLGKGLKIFIAWFLVIPGLVYAAIKALEYFGFIDDEQTARQKKNAKAAAEAHEKKTDRRIKALQKESKAEQARLEHEINLQRAFGKETFALEVKKLKAQITAGREFIKLQKEKAQTYVIELGLLAALEEEDSDRYKSLKKKLKESNKAIAESYKETVGAINALEILQAENSVKGAENAKKTKQDLMAFIKKQYEDESKLAEELENQKLALMQDGIDKEKALRQDAFNDYKDNFLKEKMAEEQAALDKKFENGKLSEKEYIKATSDLRLNAEANLTEAEKQILTNAKLILNQDLLAIDEKHQAEVKKRTEDFQKKMLEDERKRKLEFDMQIETLEELNYQAKLSDQARELYLVEEKYAEMERMAKGNAEAEKTLEEAKGREVDAIKKKFADEDKKQRQDQINKGLDLAKGQFQALGDLALAFNAKSKAGQLKAFNVKKVADIASATIDTYKAANSAYSSMSGIPVVGPALGAVAAGIAVAAGLLNVKKIASQKFEGGSTSGGGGGGGGGDVGGLTAGGGQAPNFNVVGNNGLNQLAQLQQQPTQAFVVSGHVTTAQSLDRNRIENATL